MAAATAQAPDWDLTPYFSGLGADDYRTFRAELERDLAALLARAEALPGPASGPAWVELLVDVEEATVRYWHVSSFLGCTTAADSADELGQREDASFAAQAAVLEKLTSRVRAALGSADDDAFAVLLADARLAPVVYHLDRLRRDAARRMPVELEALSADLGVDGLQAWGRLYDRISGSLEFALRVGDAEPRRLPVSMVRSLREDPDAEVRRAAHVGSAAAWQSVAEPAAAARRSSRSDRAAPASR